MAYYTQGEIDIMINKAQQALAYNSLECLTAREIGRDTKPFYLKGRMLSGVVKAFSATDGIQHHQYTNAQIEKLMGCLNMNGANKFNFSVIGSVVQRYSASITKGDTGATGLTGPDGTRGSIWRYGAGAPSVIGTDANNDIYLNTTNGDIYSFSGASWGSSVDNIYGAQGVRGYTYPGTSVDTGYAMGATGTLICRPNTDAGDNDALAYTANDRVLLTDTTRANTFAVVVIDSYNQATGAMAFTAANFEYMVILGVAQTLPHTGFTSTSWTLNITGRVGETGAAGSQGIQGTRGGTWSVGTGAPTHVGTEVDGDMYLNSTNGDVYRNDSTTWGSAVDNITGPIGPTGLTGNAGLDAVLDGQLVEHNTVGAAHAVTASEALLSNLEITCEGSSGRRHVTLTMLIQATATSVVGYFGIYKDGVLVNDATVNDTTKYSVKWQQGAAGDNITHVVAITTIIQSCIPGTIIDARGILSIGTGNLIAGNLRIFREN